MLQRLTLPLLPFAPTLLRAVIGVTFLVNGWSKLQDVPAFGTFVASLGFAAPTFLSWLVIVMETFGGLLLIVGLGTRWLCLCFVAEMLTTALVVKVAHGVPFIVADAAAGLGFEMDLMVLVALLALFALGPGGLSIDRDLLRRGRTAILA